MAETRITVAGKYYITTAIDYVNSPPHIGTAYEKISADVFARYHRLIGEDVYFQMGNDEHSLNVERAALAKSMEPVAYCNDMEKVFRGTWAKLEILFDGFLRTTDERHVRSLRRFFGLLRDDIYRGHYEGYYCESCEAFLREKDLVDGHCPTHGTRPTWIKEENHFFRLSKYEGALLSHIEENPGFIEPQARRNEILQLLRGGLEDVSISRSSTTWGVPLPMDETQVIYVWPDALSNYITGVGFGRDEESFRKWWPADVHIIGKDITRLHCVLWPAMLMSAGLALPRMIFGHGFVYFKGERLSKSRGVTVDPLEAADLFGASALRYFLMREATYGRDVDFTWEQFQGRYDSELANDLGNLVSRSVAMIGKFLGGTVPKLPGSGDGTLSRVAGQVRAGFIEDMNGYVPSSALARIWELVRRANVYIEEEKPWALAGKDSERLKQVLFDVLETIRQAAIMVWPVMPGKSEEILGRLGLADLHGLGTRPGNPALDERLRWGEGWPETIRVIEGPPVFPKYSDADLKERFGVVAGDRPATGEPVGQSSGEKCAAAEGPLEETPAAEGRAAEESEGGSERHASSPTPPGTDGETGEMVTFETFKELDLRLARVVKAQRVEGTTKLLKMTVDLGGGDTRQMVAGIAAAYDPEDLIGRDLVVVANLEPAKIRGIESRAMLLAAVKDDRIAIVVPDSALPPGTKVS